MQIYIWGTKMLGRYTANCLKKKYNVEAFVDNNFEDEEKTVDEIKVLSFEDFKKIYLSKKGINNIFVLLTATNSKSIYMILGQLNEINVKNIGIIKARAGRYHLPIDLEHDEVTGEIIWVLKDGEEQVLLPRLEVNLIDNCNLNCKSCTHFSSLYRDKSTYKITTFETDLKRLREIGKILRLRLLGGEPLLLSGLSDYLLLAREIYPEADIELVTNGILIPKLTDATLNVIRENDISLVISPYQPTIKIKDKLEEVLNFHNIRFVFDGNEILEFSRTLTLKDEHCSLLSSEVCASSSCMFLRNGKLFKCPIEGLIKDFGRFYELEEIFGRFETGYSIYHDKVEVEKKIKDLAMKPVEICKFCSEKVEWIPWQVLKNPVLKDWLYCEEC